MLTISLVVMICSERVNVHTREVMLTISLV